MVASEEIVISGIGGNFPKSKNIEELKKLLFENYEEFIGEALWQSGEFNICNNNGNMPDSDRFDAAFFGVHRHQTKYLDPLTRIALENTFEALIDAGVNPVDIRNTRTGVFISSTISENDSFIYDVIENGYGITGQARSMLANRISHWMNAKGPSYINCGTWTSGFRVIKHACEAIRTGQCDAAIVGGANFNLKAKIQFVYTKLGVVSPDGQTRSFDENAQGYCRSDSIVILYLQRSSEAKRCYATVLNVDDTFNGNRPGNFSQINPDSARNFLTNFYQQANVNPADVQYVEAYGSGLKALDELELNLLDDVFNKERPHNQPLLVGSVKSNLGHAEASAPFVSIVKTIIAMETGKIPANLNFKNPNKNIEALRDGRIKIVTENTPWPGTLAAVNSFGLVSSYGHILLKGKEWTVQSEEDKETLPHLYVLSTRTEEGIQEILNEVKAQPTLNTEYMHLINNVFKTHIPGHLYRGYLVQNAQGYLKENTEHFEGARRPVWFVYSGMGSQWIGMGRQLLQIPVFAAAIAKCHKTLEPFDIDLYHIITSEDDPKIFNNILHSFVGIAAIQIGLTDALMELGLKPDNMIGHSVGELGCAYADGCLTAEQMILSAYYRGRASVEVELTPGLMAAVGLGAKQMKSMCPEEIDIACCNGPESCTLSGPSENMSKLITSLQNSGIFARLVNVAGIAYHSRYIKPAGPLLLNYLKKIIPSPKARSSKWLSTSVPEANGGWNSDIAKYASAEYLTNNLLSSVQMEAVLQHVPDNAVLIEIAPHGLLQAILKRSLHNDCTNISLTKRDEKNLTEFFFASLGELYLTGCSLNIPNLYNKSLQKKTCCSRGTPPLAPLVRWSHTNTWRIGVDFVNWDLKNYEDTFKLDKNTDLFNCFKDYRITNIKTDNSASGMIVTPITCYMMPVCDILLSNSCLENIAFENMHLNRHRTLLDGYNACNPSILVSIERGNGRFEISDTFGILSTGRIINCETSNITEDVNQNLGKKMYELKGDELYEEFSNRGQEFTGGFRSIERVEFFENGMVAQIECKSEWYLFVCAMLHLKIFREGEATRCPFETVFIQSISLALEEQKNQKGSTLQVVYNYISNVIHSSIATIHGVRCEPCNIECSYLVADRCYSPVTKDIQGLNDKITAINLKEPTLGKVDFESDIPWLTELNLLLNDGTYKRIYLISRILPTGGIDSFLSKLQSLQNGDTIRLIFILDANTPEFKSTTDLFYQFAFSQRQANVFVYHSRKWESRCTISSKLDDLNKIKEQKNSMLFQNNMRRDLPNVDIHYMGINSKNPIPRPLLQSQSNNKLTDFNILTEKSGLIENRNSSPVGAIDYCGIENGSGRRVMGIAQVNAKNHLIADPIFRWPISNNWSLIDGATVPFAYTIAYYILFDVTSIQPGESILIHNGCSSIGQALIQVAYCHGCIIYTSVANEKQRSALLKHMPMLHETSIFIYTTKNMDQQIMHITRGIGINVIVSCLSENNLEADFRCTTIQNRIVYIFNEDHIEEQYCQTVGMSIFLRCRRLQGLKLSKIFALPEDTKKRLHAQVLKGIETKTVNPLIRNIVRERGKLQFDHMARYFTNPKLFGAVILPVRDIINKRSIQANKDDLTYIVYGGNGNESNALIATIHWLANINKVKTIIVLSSLSNDTKKYLLRSLCVLKLHHPDIHFEFLEVGVNRPEIGLHQIIQRDLSNISAAIMFTNGSSKEDVFIKQLQDKFVGSRVVLASSVENLNEINMERYHKDFNQRDVSIFRWEKKLRFTDVAKFMESAIEETVDILVRSCIIDKENIADRFTNKEFFTLLSSSVSLLTKVVPVEKNYRIKLATSHTSRKICETPPMFIIPGLFGAQCKYLNSAIKNFLSPVYILEASYESMPLEKLAACLGDEIRSIYPIGFYNLLGVSTGGVLAIELAKYLEIDCGETVQLFLLDGHPITLQNIFKEDDATTETSQQPNNFEITLLQKLLDVDQEKLLDAPLKWQGRLQTALRNSSYKFEQAERVLKYIKQQIDVVLSYKSNNKRHFNGLTRLVIPAKGNKDNFNLDDCKQVKVEVIQGNHFTMLETKNLNQFMNNNILIPPLYT